MRIEKLHQRYVHELEALYGSHQPTSAPTEKRPVQSHDNNLFDAEQEARQLDRIFEWLGKPPVLPGLRS